MYLSQNINSIQIQNDAKALTGSRCRRVRDIILLALRKFLRAKAQLSPRRSHFYVDTDYLESPDEKIAMIYVVTAKVDSIKERWVGSKSRKKQYTFVLNLQWSDGSSSIIWRSYNDFFDFQCGLLDSFPEEAGTVRGFVRTIPYLPGKKIFRKNDLTLAEERKPDIESYAKKLIKLPPKISQSNNVMSFFKRKHSDPEWFQQFPQGINRQGDHADIIDSRDSMEENTVKEVQHVLQGADLLYEDCSGQDSYLNPTFEASGSLPSAQNLQESVEYYKS